MCYKSAYVIYEWYLMLQMLQAKTLLWASFKCSLRWFLSTKPPWSHCRQNISGSFWCALNSCNLSLVSLAKGCGQNLQNHTQSDLGICFSICDLRLLSLEKVAVQLGQGNCTVSLCISRKCWLKIFTGISWLQWRQCLAFWLAGVKCLIKCSLKFWTWKSIGR